MRKITIYEDEDHELTDTIEEVKFLIKGGFTSGIDPEFNIEEA